MILWDHKWQNKIAFKLRGECVIVSIVIILELKSTQRTAAIPKSKNRQIECRSYRLRLETHQSVSNGSRRLLTSLSLSAFLAFWINYFNSVCHSPLPVCWFGFVPAQTCLCLRKNCIEWLLTMRLRRRNSFRFKFAKKHFREKIFIWRLQRCVGAIKIISRLTAWKKSNAVTAEWMDASPFGLRECSSVNVDGIMMSQLPLHEVAIDRTRAY